MAIDTSMYSMQQFQVAVIAETTLGTTAAESITMQYVNIDGYPSVSRTPERYLDVRHGAGTTAKKVDVYVSQNGKVKEISFTAFYDQTLADIFIENCMGVAVDSAPVSHDIAYNFTGVECKHGDTDTDNTGALTVALLHPEGSNSEIYPGCFVDSLRMYADVSSDGGRFKMDVVLKTRHNISGGQAIPSTPAVPTPYPSTYRTIFELTGKQSIDGADIVMHKFDLTLNSQVKFFGNGALGIPDTIARGIPEFLVTGIFGIKYDSNTAAIIAKQYDENDVIVEISDNATWGSSTFGIKGSYGQISDNFDPSEIEGGAFFDLPIKFMAHTEGDVIQIVP